MWCPTNFSIKYDSKETGRLFDFDDSAAYDQLDILWTELYIFIARHAVSTLTRDIDIAILSVCLSVRPSVRNVPVLDKNGLTYCHSFFHHTVAQSF